MDQLSNFRLHLGPFARFNYHTIAGFDGLNFVFLLIILSVILKILIFSFQKNLLKKIKISKFLKILYNWYWSYQGSMAL